MELWNVLANFVLPRRPDGRSVWPNEGLSDFLQSSFLFFPPQICLFDPNLPPSHRRSVSLQDVQVDRRVLDQGHEPVVDFLDDETLLWFSLPAALHELVDLFRTRPRPLQLPALRDALDRLHTSQTFRRESRFTQKWQTSYTCPDYRLWWNCFSIHLSIRYL